MKKNNNVTWKYGYKCQENEFKKLKAVASVEQGIGRNWASWRTNTSKIISKNYLTLKMMHTCDFS